MARPSSIPDGIPDLSPPLAAARGSSPELPERESSPELPTRARPPVPPRASSPELATRASSPELATRRSSPAPATRTSSPELATRGSSPAPATRTSSPELATRASSPELATRGSSPDLPALGISEEEQRHISELYAKLNRIDHYRLLGVAATADVKEIKRAYHAKAKEHHPDRWFRKEIGSFRPKVDAIFNAITAAEKTLSNSEKRAGYDAYLRELLKTRIARRHAASLEAAKEWRAAAEAWARIVENLPTDAYVQHRYAYALLRARKDHHVAIEAATRAIELDSTRAEYRITAASLHLAEGRDRSALAQLTVASGIEPDRADLGALHAALAERVSRER